jgi:hypothetical protein
MFRLFFVLVCFLDAVVALTIRETSLLSEEPVVAVKSPAVVARMNSPGAYKVDGKAFHRYSTLPSHTEVSTAAAESGSSEFVAVKDLSLKTIRVVDDIVVECYAVGDCDYTLTAYDKRMLSLYASVIENCADDIMDTPYSLGILRDKDSEYTMGLYAYGGSYGGSSNDVSYWIRLHWNDGSRVHDHPSSLSKMLAVMELAVHERAHHQYSGGHDNAWQVIYNTYFGRAIRNLDKYSALAENILGEEIECQSEAEESMVAVLLIIGGVLVVGLLGWIALRFL